MLKIFNCYSFLTKVLDRYIQNPDIYIPIGGGGYRDEYVRFADDTGDNISKYNSLLNEITVIYWVGKHLSEFGDPDYIGFGHYRRYLNFDDAVKLHMDQNVIIVPKREILPDSVYSQYARCHVKADMDAFIKKFDEVFPEQINDFIEFLSQNTISWCNIFIMHKSRFAKYLVFMEECIKICINLYELSDVRYYNKYQARAYSFLLERISAFWYFRQSKLGISVIDEFPLVIAPIASPYRA